MIIDKIAEMTWTSNTKKYYMDKGYVFTKMYDKFEVGIEDLNFNSNLKVNVECDICNKIKKLSYRKYIKNIRTDGYYSCSQKCSHNKSKNTKLKRYADENYNNHNKFKETIMERFGVENPSQNNIIKSKKKETCLKNFGVEYPSQSKEIQEITKKTCLEKYGYEYPWLNNIIKEKVNKTMMIRYGVKCATKNKSIMNKIIKTQIDRYGEMWINHVPRYNPNSIIYLDFISEKLGLPIEHALNGGEKKLIKYWIDGYISEYNICIEWDEKEHRDNIEYDREREQYLIDNKDCKFVRIDEEEFLENVESGVLNSVCKIEELINKLK